MSAPKFTAGPYRILDGELLANNDEVLGVIYRTEAWSSGEKIETEDQANAALLGASFDLYAALEDMLAGWRYIRQHHGDLYGVGWDRAQSAAEAALSRARGETL